MTSNSTLFVESEQKLPVQEHELERPTSAGRHRTLPSKQDEPSIQIEHSLSQEKIAQKLDATMKEVSHFRNIITFDTEIKQSYLQRSDSETERLLQDLKQSTSSIQLQTAEEEAKQEEKTFATSLSEEELENARRRREARRWEEQTQMWKDGFAEKHLTMKEVLGEKVHEHYSRGVMEANEGRFEAALTSFHKAINLHPSDPSCYVERGEAYLQLCDFRSAFLNYKKALTLQPDNPHIIDKLAFISYMEGQCLFDQGLFTEALESYVRAADLKPNAKGYHLRAITCLAALGRHQECLALITRRLDAEATGNPELYVLRARLHLQFGNVTLSYYDVRDALSLDGDLEQAVVMMKDIEKKADDAKQAALELTIQGKLSEALNKMSTAVQTNPSKAEYHVLRGALYRRVENFNSAIDDYLLAMDKSDHNEESSVYQDAQRQLLLTYNDFAVHCYQKGFYEEAVILLNKAIKGEKNEKGLYVNRGDCFFKLNNLGFALADYQQALEIDPTCWAIKCRISVVQNEFGIAAYQERLYNDAVDYFSDAIEHNGKVGQFYVHRARALYMLEEVGGARNDILVALHMDPENEEMIPLLSRLFPGRTVSEVLRSKVAEGVRKQLASTITPHSKLPPLSRASSSHVSTVLKHLSSAPLSAASTSTGLISMEPSTPKARRLPSDSEILQLKKQIVGELRSILTFPVSLRSKQPKVLSSIPVQQAPSPTEPPNKNEKVYYNWKKV